MEVSSSEEGKRMKRKKQEEDGEFDFFLSQIVFQKVSLETDSSTFWTCMMMRSLWVSG